MLRRFAGRTLLAAKTSVKEPVKAKTAAKKKEKKVQVVIDRTKFHHNDWLGTTIFDLAKALPHPELPSWDDRDTWLHKNAQGLKFYRPLWTRYPEPCYWTVAKIKIKKKPAVKHSRVWGFLTWRGRTEPLPRPIPGSHRKEWRILLEPGTQLGPSIDNCWTAPEITLESDPKLSTQLPEDLPGVQPGTWPYPWGKQGTRNFPREPPSTERSKEIAEKRREAAEADKSEHEEAILRAGLAHEAAIVLGPPSQALEDYFDEEGERMKGPKAEPGTPLFDEEGDQVAVVQVDETGAQSIVEVDEDGEPVQYKKPAGATARAGAVPEEFDEDLLEHSDADVDADEDGEEGEEGEQEDEDGLDDEDKQWVLEDGENPAMGEMDEASLRGAYQKRSERRGLPAENEEEEDDRELDDIRLEAEMNKEERARLLRRRANREAGGRSAPRFDEDGEEIDEEEDEEVDEDEDEEGEEDAEAALEAQDVEAEAEAAEAEADAAAAAEGEGEEGEGEEGAEGAEGEAAEDDAANTPAADGPAGAKKPQ